MAIRFPICYCTIPETDFLLLLCTCALESLGAYATNAGTRYNYLSSTFLVQASKLLTGSKRI
jgi:hypothetical protein